jgi:hypothetical protein
MDEVPTHPAPGGGIPFDPNTFKKLAGVSSSSARRTLGS